MINKCSYCHYQSIKRWAKDKGKEYLKIAGEDGWDAEVYVYPKGTPKGEVTIRNKNGEPSSHFVASFKVLTESCCCWWRCNVNQNHTRWRL